MSNERRLVVDRIENDIVVLESDSVLFDVPRSAFPDVQEGDVLVWTKHEPNTTGAEARIERLKSRSPQPKGGDIIDL